MNVSVKKQSFKHERTDTQKKLCFKYSNLLGSLNLKISKFYFLSQFNNKKINTILLVLSQQYFPNLCVNFSCFLKKSEILTKVCSVCVFVCVCVVWVWMLEGCTQLFSSDMLSCFLSEECSSNFYLEIGKKAIIGKKSSILIHKLKLLDFVAKCVYLDT